MKHKARLEGWTIHRINDFLQITGNVYGHPQFTDGELIRTSKVVNFNPRSRIVETLNTYYKLGAPAQDEPAQSKRSYN